MFRGSRTAIFNKINKPKTFKKKYDTKTPTKREDIAKR
jgi:hypothetical protein